MGLVVRDFFMQSLGSPWDSVASAQRLPDTSAGRVPGSQPLSRGEARTSVFLANSSRWFSMQPAQNLPTAHRGSFFKNNPPPQPPTHLSLDIEHLA